MSKLLLPAIAAALAAVVAASAEPVSQGAQPQADRLDHGMSVDPIEVLQTSALHLLHQVGAAQATVGGAPRTSGG